MTACSGAITAAVTVAFSDYSPPDLNDGHIEYNYYAGAGLAAVALPVFVHVAYQFRSCNAAIPNDALLENDHLDSIEVVEGGDEEHLLGEPEHMRICRVKRAASTERSPSVWAAEHTPNS
jgi:hypothetical protein